MPFGPDAPQPAIRCRPSLDLPRGQSTCESNKTEDEVTREPWPLGEVWRSSYPPSASTTWPRRSEDFLRAAGIDRPAAPKCRQAADSLADLDLGEVLPLDLALGIPQENPTAGKRKWRNWQTRWIQVPVG